MEVFFFLFLMHLLARSCAILQLLACWSGQGDIVMRMTACMCGHIFIHLSMLTISFSFLFLFSLFFFCFAPMCSSKKFLSMSALSPFWRKAVGCNFPPIFGMTLSGPVGIDAPVSHHAAGGMINNKHWWILHCPCGFCHYLAAPKYHLQL